MRLLIVTQKVDPSDPVLGFFTGWLEAFAKEAEGVIVIAQAMREGSELPQNVKIISLGKESHVKKYQQVLRYWKYLYIHRKEYDVALVHMTPIWSVLGAPLWWLLGKRHYLWYEARGTRLPLHIALKYVRKVFSASTYGMPLPTPKSVVVGHGIDTSSFTPSQDTRDEKHFITVSRISRTKRLEIILGCLMHFGEGYRLTIGGSALTEEDTETLRMLQRFMHQNHIADRVQIGFVSKAQVIGLYQTAGLFLHTSESGLDKTILEAMACECLVLSTSPAVEGILPEECRALEATIFKKAKSLLALPPAKKKALRQKLRDIVEEQHSLPRLVKRLLQEMAA
jgi:glycosyltransferase involved in cell wall biosynthesis